MNGVEKLRHIQDLLREHHTKEARPLIEELIHAEPSNVEVWYWRGVCERFDGELDLAENDFLSVIRQNPHHDRAFFGLGDILENKGNQKDAVAAYHQAASLGNKEAAKKLARYGSLSIANQPTVPPHPVRQQPPQEVIAPSMNPAVELKTEQGIDYTRLRDFLAAGKWKEADLETARILRKITHHNDVSLKDISSLPCLDLHSVNELWTRYSQGRFGISVQGKIYQSVGGLVAPEGYEPQTIDWFVKRIGWHTTKSTGYRQPGSALLGSTHLSYSLSAPPGHLPGAWILPKQSILYPKQVGCFSYISMFIVTLLYGAVMSFIFGIIGALIGQQQGLTVGVLIGILLSLQLPFSFLSQLSEGGRSEGIQRKLVVIFSRAQSCGLLGS